jgi:futalosine hydrolase
MQPIIVTASTMQELTLLIRAAGASPAGDGFREVYGGRIGKCPIIIAVTGMGKVNAASAVTALLEKTSPRLLINTGCAGAYGGSGLTVGDLAIASAEIFADEGVATPAGWKPLDCIGIPLVQRNSSSFYNEFPLSMRYAEKAVHLAVALGLHVRRGKFLTVSTCSGTAARGDELHRLFGGVCENMEGAAVAQVALMYNVDSFEVRGISNMVEDRDLSRWDITRAVEQVQRFLVKYIEAL